MHRLDVGLFSHPKEFCGMESERILTPREKSPLPNKQTKKKKKKSKKDGTHDAASSRTSSPTHIIEILLWFQTPSQRCCPWKLFINSLDLVLVIVS